MTLQPDQINVQNLRFDYEPYPVGFAAQVLEVGLYERLAASWPETDLFQFKKELGKKYSLSEVNNSRNYGSFIRSQPDWRDFHAYVKGRGFLYSLVEVLQRNNLDVGLGGNLLGKGSGALSLVDRLKVLRKTRGISSRFEFSMLPADGGFIKPHTDSPGKVITLVFGFMKPGEWDPAFGGGTAILRPRDPRKIYNHMNRQFEFEDVETIREYPFEPNQVVLFIKTFNSWHAVNPIRGAGSSTMRKTLTLNIEAR